MLRRILIVALVAGAASGFFMSAVQMIWSVPLIIAAEAYESEPAPAPAQAQMHVHADGMVHDHGAAGGHDHGEGWAPEDGFERTLWTVITNVLMGVGAGLVLAAFLSLRKKPATLRTGLVFGAAAFASISLAPALGLPPELPGMAAAELQGRQAWWLMTAAVTALSIGAIVYAPATWMRVVAVMVLFVPHLIGAPQPASHETAVPSELIAEFIAASLITAALFWIALGGSVGYLAGRLGLTEPDAAA